MLIDFDPFGKEMIETPLLGQGPNLVISTPEVADQHALEDSVQNLFDHERGSTFRDDIVTER